MQHLAAGYYVWPEPSRSSLSLRDRSPQLHESSQSLLIITKFELLPIVEHAPRMHSQKSYLRKLRSCFRGCHSWTARCAAMATSLRACRD